MSRTVPAASLAVLLLVGASVPARAQGLMGDLIKDIATLESKFVGLAKAMPDTKYDWRPAAGVRSVGEVLLHVVADNYVMPFAVGVDPDPATGISMTDFKTFSGFEKKHLGQAEMVAAIEKSFAHLKKAMTESPDAKLGEDLKFFGQTMSRQSMWVATTTHLHEHLGQLVAYARSNGIVPPWSK